MSSNQESSYIPAKIIPFIGRKVAEPEADQTTLLMGPFELTEDVIARMKATPGKISVPKIRGTRTILTDELYELLVEIRGIFTEERMSQISSRDLMLGLYNRLLWYWRRDRYGAEACSATLRLQLQRAGICRVKIGDRNGISIYGYKRKDFSDLLRKIEKVEVTVS